MSLDSRGFLSPEISEWITRFRTKHLKWFALAEQVSEASQRLMLSVDAKRDNLAHMVAAPLLTRCIEHFQAVILLAERGMLAPAKVVSRAQLEALFTLRAMERNPDLVREYAHEDEWFRRRFMEMILNTTDPKAQSRPDRVAKLREIVENIEQGGIRKLKTKELADMAGLTQMYVTAYVALSQTVHTKIRDLESHVETVDGEVVQFTWGPNDESLALLMLVSIEVQLVVMHSAGAIFQVDSQAIDFDQRLQAVAHNDSTLAAFLKQAT